MIRFYSDYGEGAHPAILERLIETNLSQTPGYGEDAHCENAARMIRELCAHADAAVHFLVGGTQANLTVLAHALRPHQGVVCAESAHINVHETGAIEATGHKVLALPARDGKLTAQALRETCAAHVADETREHMVIPGAAFISNSSELGTIYTLAELRALRAVCDEYGLLLYLDGARLGFALAAAGNDLTLPQIAALCDAFYIGGTKQGALFGEAVVITNPRLARDFRYSMKQRGAMLAKGRLLGIQFETLLSGGLYMDISTRANALALRIRAAAVDAGYALFSDSPTNQQFLILPDDVIARLSTKYAFAHIARVDESRSAVRFCTGWATRAEDVDALVRDLARE
ncbi:MAG: threonine aldolase family protein [Christensenellales bacterium]|jgi:threonine aldolase